MTWSDRPLVKQLEIFMNFFSISRAAFFQRTWCWFLEIKFQVSFPSWIIGFVMRICSLKKQHKRPISYNHSTNKHFKDTIVFFVYFLLFFFFWYNHRVIENLTLNKVQEKAEHAKLIPDRCGKDLMMIGPVPHQVYSLQTGPSSYIWYYGFYSSHNCPKFKNI